MPTVGAYSTKTYRKGNRRANVNLALVTGQLAKEITDVGKEMEKLFGVLDEEMLQLQ